MVGAQVGGAEIDIEEVGAAGKMQGTGLRGEALALFEDIGDVFAGEGLGVEGVLDGASQVVLAVDVGEGDDFVDVDAGVETALGELAVVVFRARAQGVEAQQELGVGGFAALVEEFLYVVGIFEVPVPLVAAGMSGNQIGPVIDAEPVGEEFEGEACGSVRAGTE